MTFSLYPIFQLLFFLAIFVATEDAEGQLQLLHKPNLLFHKPKLPFQYALLMGNMYFSPVVPLPVHSGLYIQQVHVHLPISGIFP